MYDLKLQKFEGPFDLLIELIEANKLDITEISLASVTAQYLNFLEKLDNVEISYLSEFLVIASRLLLLKSKMLLPKPKPKSPSPNSLKRLPKSTPRKISSVVNPSRPAWP